MQKIQIKYLGIPLFAALLVVGFHGSAMAKGEPVMMLMQVAGHVEYSKDGEKWFKVNQNKMLFEGTQIRSGEGGSGRLIHQVSGVEQELGAHTVIKVSATGAELVSGQGLGEGKTGENDLMSGIKNRFAKAERYTVVRRSVDKSAGVEGVDVAKEVTLSAMHPDLVWEGKGPDYTYELTIDGQRFTVPATQESVVRHKVSGLTPGRHTYHVALQKGGMTVSHEEKPGTLTWMSPAEEETLKGEIAASEKKYPGNFFTLASILEKHGLTVAAMETYQKYLAAHDDDNDFRPFLIKTLQDLQLGEMKKAEVKKYNSQIGKP
ncbi:MAG: hypothetical protein HQL63_06755 [Magnetococcales bacterium]|nr:hypothetical protein [Magnetococcales bacterium]MBF0322807.1 hypothetical protein [Magnetococcales bacterium]